MKFVKLSLVAALAAGSFSVANATPLEEAIKDIDFSGAFRYRYQSGRYNKGVDTTHGFNGLGGNKGGVSSKQKETYKLQMNFKAAIADNFKAFIQLEHNSTDGGFGADSVSNVSNPFNVRQAYLEYHNPDTYTTIIAGRQQLNTIWTGSGIAGLVGTGAKLINNRIDGLTLAAFAVDSFNAVADGDTMANYNPINANGNAVNLSSVFEHNMYGLAAIGSYDALNGTLSPQFWVSHIKEVATLYALDLDYKTTFDNGVKWGLRGTYLGNTAHGDVKDALAGVNINFGDGNFFGLRGTLQGYGWDTSLAGVYYGDEDEFTFNILEDLGSIDNGLIAGQEIWYTSGSHLYGDIGRNIFGYATLGYTFAETVRIGADVVYGGTKTQGVANKAYGGDKFEAVARVNYKYSPKLTFTGWYSYIDVDAGNAENEEGKKNTVRLQALYKF